MKILYNRYKDKNNNLFVVIGKYVVVLDAVGHFTDEFSTS